LARRHHLAARGGADRRVLRGGPRRRSATIDRCAAEELRAERASARGHAAVDERHARQLPQEEKAARATYAVVNDGAPEDLERALSDVLVKLGR
jgi:hypothetical protein